MEYAQNNDLVGIITARDCPSCGHHEIGITTSEGVFLPLRPGTWVQILKDRPKLNALNPPEKTNEDYRRSRPETEPEKIPWVPAPARKFQSLALKYGVMIPAELKPENIDGGIFEKAYLHKLRSLIEKQTEKPLAVILDQFFAAAHLASGDPGEIALNMWNELEEIREPAERIRQWFMLPEDEGKSLIINDTSEEIPFGSTINDSQLSEKLESLTLEQFLSLL